MRDIYQGAFLWYNMGVSKTQKTLLILGVAIILAGGFEK